jgi:hypothetical protein
MEIGMNKLRKIRKKISKKMYFYKAFTPIPKYLSKLRIYRMMENFVDETKKSRKISTNY